jgi:hypothetical protein
MANSKKTPHNNVTKMCHFFSQKKPNIQKSQLARALFLFFFGRHDEKQISPKPETLGSGG